MKKQIFKKTFVFTCLFSLLTEVVYPSVTSIILSNSIESEASLQSSSGGDGSPVADEANGMVDLYTGDFNYGVPLMSVPGPNGENVNISLSYHGGIRVNEKASWVGLGWDYNPGEISRQVVGYADDYSGQPVYLETIGISGGGTNPLSSQLVYGPFHYDKMAPGVFPHVVVGSTSYQEGCDIIALENAINPNTYSTIVMSHNGMSSMPDNPPRFFSKPSAPAELPAYDQYYVSGPGISGKLRPYIFTGAALYKNRAPGNTYYPTKNKTQFYFDNSTTKSLWGSDAPNNRIKSGHFVKYYTNSEINNTANLFDNSTQVGFLDYRTVSGTRRPTSDFEGNSIGGIEVTDPTGMTYHYSLPVYTKDELAKTLEYTPSAANDLNLTSTNILKMAIVYKKYPYATSWKLTSVTGPDYQDVNGNKTVDEGDKGYWIAYNYSLWNNDHISTTNIYNASESYLRQMSMLTRLNYSGYTPPTYKRNFNIAQAKNQIYYLDNIKTATHTAFFIKDIRLDEHSYDNVLFTSTKPYPLLKLSKIVLLRNQDKSLIQNTAGWNLSNVDSRFNTNLCSSPLDPNLTHINKYNTNKTLIDAKSLKTIELKTDYSLCKKLYNNINNTFSSAGVTRVVWGGTGLPSYNCGSSLGYATYNKTSGYSTTDAANSGKLTLNEVLFYEDGATKLIPSYLFDYDKSNATKNPDFDPEKTDLWGFYKSDYTGYGCSHYPTPTSATDVDAWSLKEITTPVGEKIKIEYEPDEYVKEGYNDDPWNPNWLASSSPPKCKPTIIYPLNTYNSWSTAMTFVYNDYHSIYSSNYATGGNMLLNFLVVPKQKTCTTWLTAIPPTWSSLLCYQQGVPTLPAQHSSSSGGNETYTFILGFTHADNLGNMVAGTEDRPDIYKCGCSAANDYGYNRNNTFGYMLMKFNKLYGGGTRVKSITIIDPDYPTDTYKKTFSYTDGYCPVVPVQFMMGPQTNYTQFLLWDNLKMFISENGGSQVGYTNATVTSINKYGATNGWVSYSFENGPIDNPLKTEVTANSKTSAQSYNCTPYNVCGTYPTGTPIMKELHKYTIGSTLTNQQVKMLGKLNDIKHFNKSGSLVASTTYAYEKSKNITEGYIHDLNYNVNIPFTKTCGNPLTTNHCSHEEQYTFRFYSQNYTPFIRTVTNMVDGITTTSSYYQHPDFNDSRLTINTSPTEPLTKIIKNYAFQTIPKLGRKDSAEVCKNQVLLPSKVRVIRGSDASLSYFSDGYLVSENSISYTNTFNYRVYNSGTGLYENSPQTKNWYTQDETASRLLDDKTLGTNTSSGTYRMNSKTTLFNKDNTLLEEKGLNDRRSAVKFGYNNLYKLSSISNANYNSFTFSGYEDTLTVATGVKHFGGEISGGQFRCTTEYAKYTSGPIPVPILSSLVAPHTGSFVAKVPPNTFGPGFNGKNIEKGRTYRAQVWVHKESPNDAKLVLHLTGTDISSAAINQYIDVARNNTNNVQVGDWILMTVELNVPSTINLSLTHNLAAYVWNLNSTTAAYYDDFNLHPIDAPITGNVYDLRTGRLTATLDEENYATKYNYDAAGRVVSVIKETKANGLVKIMEKGYHNSRP